MKKCNYAEGLNNFKNLPINIRIQEEKLIIYKKLMGVTS